VKQSLKGSEFSWNDSGGKYFLRSDCVCLDASIMQLPNCRPEVQPVAVPHGAAGDAHNGNKPKPAEAALGLEHAGRGPTQPG